MFKDNTKQIAYGHTVHSLVIMSWRIERVTQGQAMDCTSAFIFGAIQPN